MVGLMPVIENNISFMQDNPLFSVPREIIDNLIYVNIRTVNLLPRSLNMNAIAYLWNAAEWSVNRHIYTRKMFREFSR